MKDIIFGELQRLMDKNDKSSIDKINDTVNGKRFFYHCITHAN